MGTTCILGEVKDLAVSLWETALFSMKMKVKQYSNEDKTPNMSPGKPRKPKPPQRPKTQRQSKQPQRPTRPFY